MKNLSVFRAHCRVRHLELLSFQRFILFHSRNKAFSLVEMLMALLVASLLLAALAPVMTKKFGENINVSGIGGVKGDYSRVWYYDENKEYQEWNIPNGVNIVKITSIGGGGAGGGSTYGSKVFTTDETWQVPAGVTKLRVFMVGGGGAGANGGVGIGTATAAFPGNSSWSSKDFTSTGETSWLIPTAYRAPALDTRCLSSGVTQWTYIQNNVEKKVSPGTGGYFQVTACGAGGGGSGYYGSYAGGAGGGSGGYVIDKAFVANSDTLYVKVPGGGGYGGAPDGNSGGAGGYSSGGGAGAGSGNGASGGTLAGAGGKGVALKSGGVADLSDANKGKNGTGTILASGGGYGIGNDGDSQSAVSGNGGLWGAGGGGGGAWNGGGGGGGGPVTITTSSGTNTNDIIFQIGGGGGAGALWGGGGGGGGGYGAGGGGGGGVGHTDTSKNSVGAGGAGSLALNALVGVGSGNSGETGIMSSGNQRGGGGGGGYNGGSGTLLTGGKIIDTEFTKIFSSSTYCSGGDGRGGTKGVGYSGLQGALRLYYGKKSDDILKCDYSQTATGSGGGGSGQVWLGEISVSGGQELNIKVGGGGIPSTLYGESGGDGGTTSIKVTSSTEYKVLGGEGGKYIDTEDDSALAASVGAGWGIKTAGFINWANIENDKINALNNNKNGAPGNLISNGAGGGKGGNSMDRFGNILAGGFAGNAQFNGADAPVSNYGAGGGGGGGVVTEGAKPGFGGKGAPGYVYIEWGGTNGGGGASGEVAMQQNVWVTPNSVMKIYVGKGGSAKPLVEIKDKNGNIDGYKGENGENGSETYVIVKDGTNDKKDAIAKGGLGGYAGSAKHGLGGNIKTAAGGSYDENNIETIMENSAYGTSGKEEYGGNGGTLTEELCPLLSSILKAGQTSLGGCGGNVTAAGGALCYASLFANGKGNDGTGIGSGGGGGAVINNSANKGGNGAPGAVLIEWSN